MNLDYKRMFENLQEIIAKKAEQEQLYFDLLCKIEQMKKYGDIICKTLTKLPMADQIKVLESVLNYQIVCKILVEKRGIDVETDTAETG